MCNIYYFSTVIQWLRERASVLFYTYFTSLVFINLLHVTQAQAQVTLLCTFFYKHVLFIDVCVWRCDITQNVLVIFQVAHWAGYAYYEE